jgi:hypothetical protein
VLGVDPLAHYHGWHFVEIFIVRFVSDDARFRVREGKSELKRTEFMRRAFASARRTRAVASSIHSFSFHFLSSDYRPSRPRHPPPSLHSRRFLSLRSLTPPLFLSNLHSRVQPNAVRGSASSLCLPALLDRLHERYPPIASSAGHSERKQAACTSVVVASAGGNANKPERLSDSECSKNQRSFPE